MKFLYDKERMSTAYNSGCETVLATTATGGFMAVERT